jgi:integrase
VQGAKRCGSDRPALDEATGTRDRHVRQEGSRFGAAAGPPGGFPPRRRRHGTFHALRHFFATTLITNHAEPQDVQRLLRHKTLRITLETYVHWWPRRERRRGLVGDVLRAASQRTNGRELTCKIKASLCPICAR